MALWPHSNPVPLTGPGPEGGYGSHHGPLGEITYPTARGVRARATSRPPIKTLREVRPAYSHKFPAHGYVYAGKQLTEKGQALQEVQRITGKDPILL